MASFSNYPIIKFLIYNETNAATFLPEYFYIETQKQQSQEGIKDSRFRLSKKSLTGLYNDCWAVIKELAQ